MKKVIVFLILVCFSITLVSCASAMPTAAAEVPTRVSPEQANISFLVTLYEPLPEGQFLALQIADTLTGEYTFDNTVLLEKADDLHYNLVLPLTTKAILQYRYILLDNRNKITLETDVNGMDVTTRFYFPTQAALISDKVYNWTRNPLEIHTGRIQGMITTQDGLTPIEGVIVSAGGQNTQTSADGSFTLHALPTGKHTLTVFKPDLSYHPYTQEAIIAQNMATPVSIALEASQTVLVNFHVTPTRNTPPNIPISISGSIPSLGKTYCFIDYPCGNLPENTPDLSPNGDGTFSYSAEIPMGFNLIYHYTIGNEIFNIEHDNKGNPVYRSLHVSEKGSSVEIVYDEIANWSNKDYKDVWLEVIIPEHTPKNEIVSIQIRDKESDIWSAAIPIWKVSDDRWNYRISSAGDIEEIEYRYCRNSLCGSYSGLAVDQDSPLKSISFSKRDKKTIHDTINWLWLNEEMHSSYAISQLEYQPTPSTILKGIAISPAYTAALDQYLISNIGEVSKMNGDTLVFSPTWTITHNNLPTITPVAGSDMPTETLETLLQIAKNAGYTVMLHPQLNYEKDYAYWWFSAPMSDAWWTVWFEQYRQFVNHFATIAQRNNVDVLVVGADNVLPAVPNQSYPNGTPLNHPGTINESWVQVFDHARVRFDGKIFWASNPTALDTLSGYIKNSVNGIYLMWAKHIAKTDDVGLDILTEHAIYDLSLALDNIDEYEHLAIYLAIGYPSAQGAVNECVIAADDSCLDGFQISPIEPFYVSSTSDFEIQDELYMAMLQASTQHPTIDGIITTGFFNGVRMQEKSASVNGKPAQETVSEWFDIINR